MGSLEDPHGQELETRDSDLEKSPPPYDHRDPGNQSGNHGGHRHPERGLALQNICCGFYGLIVFVLGFTFIAGDALGNKHAREQEFVMMLHMVLFSIGTGFCLYLLFIVVKQEKWDTHHHHPGPRDTSGKSPQAVEWHHEGVSLYVRLGALAFGAMTITMCCIRFFDECRGAVFTARNIFLFVFVIVQTYVLVRYHQMCIQVRGLLARWGFAHLMAVNLAQWAYIVVLEAYENILHDSVSHASGGDSHGDDHGTGYDDHGEYADKYPSNDDHGDGHGKGYNDDDGLLGNMSSLLNETIAGVTEAMVNEHSIHKRAAGLSSIFNDWAGCDFAGSKQFTLAPYLFPCIVEYVLIMAAISYKMYFNVGVQPQDVGHVAIPRGKWTITSLISYGVAGVLGFACVALGVTAAVSIFEYNNLYTNLVDDPKYLASDLFFIGEISLFCLAIPATVLAAYRLKDLGWRPLDDMLDGRVLLFTYVGTIVTDTFSIISNLHYLEKDPIATPWELGRDSLAFVQSLTQVGLILDGLSRCSLTKEHAEKKPGQAVLLLLLLFNVGMWLFNVFEPKLASSFPEIPENFYGQTAWNIIKSICMPLMVFFRFHSTVCLADIMTEAYLFHPHHD